MFCISVQNNYKNNQFRDHRLGKSIRKHLKQIYKFLNDLNLKICCMTVSPFKKKNQSETENYRGANDYGQHQEIF